jgi:Leucine-rich repeat (LRR) protein
MTANKNDLRGKLKEAYSEANLNRITVALLDLYRSRQHDALRVLARRVSTVVPIDDSKISKCFSQLVMLYHPDKGAAYRREIEALSAGKGKELHRYSHILLLGDFGDLPREAPPAESSVFSAEYAWDAQEDERQPGREWNEQTFEDEQFAETREEYASTFYQAVKMKFYGSLDIELPYYYLEDFDDIEMAECGIVSLDGVEHCIHANVIDISGNALTDISDLQSLVRVTELYASGNRIGYIDSLSSLVNLRVVDVSMNEIDDISPLFGLEHLELVNVLGNPIPATQIRKLKSLGCTVLS